MPTIEIRKKLGPIYANLEKNPALKSGLFRPGLKAACVNYDKKIDVSEALAERNKGLLVILRKFGTITEECNEKNKAIKENRDKAHAENGTKYTTSGKAFNEVLAKGEKAESADALAKIQDLVNSFSKLVEDDKVHSDNKEKLGAEIVAKLKATRDSYEKESKSVESAAKQLTAEQKSLEAQV